MAQAGLFQQRDHALAEIGQLRHVVEEAELNAITAGGLELYQLVDDLFGAADQLDVAAHDPLVALVAPPGLAVAGGMGAEETLDGTVVGLVQDGLVDLARFAFGVAANDHRIDQRAHVAAYGGSLLFDAGVELRQGRDGFVEACSYRAGDEDQIRMAYCAVDAGRRAGGADQDGTTVARLGGDEGLLELPMFTVIVEVVCAGPERVEHLDEFIGDLIAFVVADLLLAEHGPFVLAKTGHDIQAPATLGDMVRRGASGRRCNRSSSRCRAAGWTWSSHRCGWAGTDPAAGAAPGPGRADYRRAGMKADGWCRSWLGDQILVVMGGRAPLR